MSGAEVVTFNLKAVINKQKTRVLFAEVDNDFADVLFSFLILPLGNIMQVFEKHYGDKTPHAVGSFNTLFNGLLNLDILKFELFGFKPSILNPENAYAFPFLNHNVFTCSFDQPQSYAYPTAYFLVLRLFTEKKASSIISDDLRIVPNGNGSIVQILNSLGIDMSGIDGAETRNVTFGLNEIMNFLKGLLISRQPLTDFILGGGTSVQFETGISLHQIEKEATSKPSKIYNLKVLYQKSTNKLLFAQAEKDFVSYIASILTIPLGIVDLHLGGNTCFNKLHHLYRSLGDFINPKYLEVSKKVQLMKPETFATKYFDMVVNDLANAEGSRMYMVTDDLTVTRLCLPSIVSLLNEMKISSSDVEEVELKIGSEEARSILKASLTSTHALSNGLNNPKFMKQRRPKQEQ